MAEEEKNQNQDQNQDQEALTKEWEEALKEQQEQGQEQEGNSSQEDIMSAWEEALKQQEGQGVGDSDKSSDSDSSDTETEGDEKLKLLRDIPLEISVEIGSTSLTLEEILKLHPNSIVELDRYIQEPVDIKINGKLVAKGELYTVKDNYGIKIVQIITPEERIKLLEEE